MASMQQALQQISRNYATGPRSMTSKRQGPRPLPLHLMTALCVWLSLPIVQRNLKKHEKHGHELEKRVAKLRVPEAAMKRSAKISRAVQNLANTEFENAVAARESM